MLLAPPSGKQEHHLITSMTDANVAAVNSNGQSGGSATFPLTNYAVLIPFRISRRRTLQKAFWVNGATAAGSVDVGIYTIAGTTATRVASSGGELQAGVSAVQVAAAFGPVSLTAGLYYMAMSANGVTGTFWRAAPSVTTGSMHGLFQVGSGAYPLPSTMTVARYTQVGFVPVMGFSELSVL